MTHGMVESMTGHRTRLVQEVSVQWHAGEDAAVDNYLELAGRMDRANALLSGLAPRGWLLIGIAALTPAFLSARPSNAALAISLGGIAAGVAGAAPVCGGTRQSGWGGDLMAPGGAVIPPGGARIGRGMRHYRRDRSGRGRIGCAI
jgi:ATP-binding cassette subfamily B protein